MALRRYELYFPVLPISLTSEKATRENIIRISKRPCNFLGPVVRKVDSAIHRIVIFSIVVKMLQEL